MNENLKTPKAYKEGKQDFYGRDFLVTKDVLIPRPETEQMIDLVLTLAGKPYLPGIKAPIRILKESPIILDVGTGSGCIAITIKKELPETKVYAVDISESALEIAKKNAKYHETEIIFNKSDLLEKVLDKTIPAPNLIVANLPYVDESWDWLDKESLSHEPSIALYAEDHGLKLIKQLIDQTVKLRINHLILEADPSQHESIKDYAKKAGLTHKEARGFMLYFSL